MDAMECDVPLEVDVYELLWRARVKCWIPETVVFKYGRLDSWFFCTSERHQPKIKRKRDYTVRRGDVVRNILDGFCAHAESDQDLVATWLSGEPGHNCHMLHLTRSSLARFLAFMKGSEAGHGVLQRWCAPFGGHSSMLRTDWSPHHFGLEMCTNWHKVNDSRHPLAQRLATFDGGVRHVTNTSVVNQNLHAKVELLNTELARCIDEQQPGSKVWYMQCNFKPCADGRVRFIWCSKLVLESTDETGFAIEREEGSDASIAELFARSPDKPFQQPLAAKWDGHSTPCDGSVFHIPKPGMSSFREPSWWGAEKLVGITNLLPSASEPPRRAGLPRVWKVENVQQAIYPQPPPPAPPILPRPKPTAEEEEDAEFAEIEEERRQRAAEVAAAELAAAKAAAAEAAEAAAAAVDAAASEGEAPYTELSPRLPALTASGASSHRSTTIPPPQPLVPGSSLEIPRSMARAVRMYQQGSCPSGLYSPRGMFKSPRASGIAGGAMAPSVPHSATSSAVPSPRPFRASGREGSTTVSFQEATSA